MSSTDILLIVLALAIVAVAAYAAVALWRNTHHRKRHQLREQFGPEYERLVQQYGDRERVERELEARARRVRKLSIRELPESQQRSFSQAWQQAQERFVDTPAIAVRSAYELVQEVMRARGYPVDDFEQSVADLSVDHSLVVQHYRAAHALHEANRAGRDDTEELRQAMVHYRVLFSELLGAHVEPSPSSRRLDPAHA